MIMKHLLAALPVLIGIIILSVIIHLFFPVQKTVDLPGYIDGGYYMYIMYEEDPFEKKDTIVYKVIGEKSGYVRLMNMKDSLSVSIEKRALKRIFYKIK